MENDNRTTDSRQPTVERLKAHPIAAHLSPDAVETIAAVAEAKDLQPGDVIIREGEESADLYLLVSGTAIAAREAFNGDQLDLNAIEPGDCIGELTFLAGGKRATTVRANTRCELVFVPAEALQAVPEASPVIGELKSALSRVVVNRARSMSDAMLSSLRRELEIQKLQNQFGQFLVFTISIFLISTVLFYLVAEEYVKDVYDPGFSWQTVFFLAVPCLLIIKFMKIPLADLGIRREGLWRSFRDSVLICIGITIPAAIYLIYFKQDSPGNDMGVVVDGFFLVQYFAHTVFQEVGSRGLLQGLFQKFLNDSKGHRAILLTSIIFASLHITFGIDAVLITFVASIVFGYVYLKQKNLIGVIVLHYWLGVLATIVVAF